MSLGADSMFGVEDGFQELGRGCNGRCGGNTLGVREMLRSIWRKGSSSWLGDAALGVNEGSRSWGGDAALGMEEGFYEFGSSFYVRCGGGEAPRD